MRTQRMAALAGAGVVLFTHAAAAQSQFPTTACENGTGGFLSTCPETLDGNKTVLVGNVNQGFSEGNSIPIYVLFYGSWSSSVDNYIENLVADLLGSLNDSVYGAIAKTYTGVNGTTGMFDLISIATVTGTNVVSEPAAEQLMLQNFGNNSAAEYLFVTDTGFWLNSTNYCAGLNWDGATTGIHMAYVHNFVSDCQPNYSWACVEGKCGSNCSGPCTSFVTPNNFSGTDTTGKIDLTLSYVAHELTEAATDPGTVALGLSGAGWYSGNTGANNQMADFCQAAPPYTHSLGTYTYPVGVAGGTANTHGAFGDFLLQGLRVNEPGGSDGYCTTSYGGAFWGTGFGVRWSPVGDWQPGSYKGECSPGQPLIGLSEYTTSPFHPHAVMCGSSQSAANFPQGSGCVAKTIAPSGFTWCPNADDVAGVAQSQSGVPDALLCCPGNNLGGFTCYNQAFNSTNMINSWTPYDWDWGYVKAECSAGNWVGGVQANSQTQLPDIECCGPVSGG